LKAQNLTGVFISHNMQHVFQSCDRVVAMARGEIVFDSPIQETSIEQVHEFL
jgi:simple sugar transport system ATP-binding protein